MVGVKVTAFELDDDREGAQLDGECDGNPVRFRLTVDADCCSHTWIESVIEENSLIGHTIASVEDIDLPGPANGNEHTTLGENYYEEQMQFYGLAITTDAGKCILDYRNSSTGSYGGSMLITKVR
jgi:hypothetical protein